jgi:4-hydroxybenzoyl-CoA thioesterase
MPGEASDITLRFLATPTDISYGGTVHGGKILEWIDRAGYACAVGWSGQYCVTAYVGNIRFARPVQIGELVEANARLIHTGRTSMHVLVTIRSADPKRGIFTQTTQCMTVFVAVDSSGRSTEIRSWTPVTEEDRGLQSSAIMRIDLRRRIEEEMARQTYADSSARQTTLRFLAAPTDVNWGGKVHGGTVMRWIDEASYVCAVTWSKKHSVAVYTGGVRFYHPVQIGHLVEVQARLLYTGRTSMHVAVHVRSSDLKHGQPILTTDCLAVFVALDEHGQAVPVPPWQPITAEDKALEQHAIRLMELRGRSQSKIQQSELSH